VARLLLLLPSVEVGWHQAWFVASVAVWGSWCEHQWQQSSSCYLPGAATRTTSSSRGRQPEQQQLLLLLLLRSLLREMVTVWLC
jgi:hypothetical protein